jgi:CHAD domain-containing protein
LAKALAETIGDRGMRSTRQPKWKGHTDPLKNAQQELPKLAREFFTAGRAAAKPRASWTQMHRFRLATKHFRYTLELFRPLYGETLEQRIERLREVQQVLGEINDCHTARELVVNESKPETTKFGVFLDGQLAARSKAFRSLWRQRFDATGEAEAWIELLAGRSASASVRRSL